jgi:FkbM family methyltransferase
MASLSRLPLTILLHRASVSLFRRAGAKSERLFGLYRRAWAKLARFQRARTYFGAVVECDLWDRVPEFIFHFGHWEPNISYWIGQRLRRGDVFVDVGSNLGYYCLLASGITGPEGKIVAIEASPRIYTRLVQSVEGNSCANVRTVNVAVSQEPGRVTIYAGPAGNSGATSTLPAWRDGKAEAEVAALPLDQILSGEEIRRVRLIKIDVEGAEAPILRQIIGTIGSYPQDVEILVECTLVDQAREWEEIFAKFLQAGFFAFGIENDYSAGWYLQWRRPCPLRPIYSLPEGQTDVLFTRDSTLADSLIKSTITRPQPA